MDKVNRLGCTSFLNEKDKKIMENYYEKALNSNTMDELDHYWISLLELGHSMEKKVQYYEMKEKFWEITFKEFCSSRYNDIMKMDIDKEVFNTFLKEIINKKYDGYKPQPYSINEIKNIFWKDLFQKMFSKNYEEINKMSYHGIAIDKFFEELVLI
jgi:hypothetical protein